MKKLIKILMVTLCIVLGLTAFVGCSTGEKNIMVIGRESGSGTRDAFDGMIKNEAGDSLAKKADGTAQPTSIFAAEAEFLNSTSLVLTTVANNKTSIGYISLGSVNDTVNVLKVGGVTPSAATVLDNTYKLQRPFVIMTNKDVTLTDLTADFIDYLKSSTGQDIVDAEKYVKQADGKTGAYTSSLTGVASGKVLLRGSTSVEPLMQKLVADYISKNSGKVTQSNFDMDAQGSSAGITDAKNDKTAGNVIGMSSSALKDTDKASLNSFNIALDAIAIITHKNNTLKDISIAQLFDIYTGKITKFSEIK